MPTFIGLDLAWTTKNESGICWLKGDSRENLRCIRLEAAVRDTDELAQEVAAASPAVVTIDAPLLYTKDRWAEREIARQFGRYKASAHQSHYAVRQGYTAGIDLGIALAARGFLLEPSLLLSGALAAQSAVEVFPHTIHVRLFGLEERIPYKPGRGRSVEQRQGAMQEYQSHLRRLVERECPNVMEHPDVRTALAGDTATSARGQALKRLDDTLDGLTCAIAAWLMWDQPERWEMIGDENGYIVVPKDRETEAGAPQTPSALGTSPAELERNEAGAQPLPDPDVTVRRDSNGIDILVETQDPGLRRKVRVRLEGDDLSSVITVVVRLE